MACQVQLADLKELDQSRGDEQQKRVTVISLHPHFRLLIIMKIPETWGPLTRHLKMLGLDWWGLQHVVMS